MALSIQNILDILDEKGMPAAVRVLVRVYEDSCTENPWGSFWPPFAVASVHVARWTLGHDKDGIQRFEPKSISDPRFKKLVSQLIPPHGSVEDLVMVLAEGAAQELSRILRLSEIIREDAIQEDAIREEAIREEEEITQGLIWCKAQAIELR